MLIAPHQARDKKYAASRLLQNLALGALLGTAYSKIPLEAVFSPYGSIYAVLMVLLNAKNYASVRIIFGHRPGIG